MRTTVALAVCIAALASPALAAEKGVILRSADLKDRPFVDGATVQKVNANQSVTILVRQGSWAQVDSGSGRGWVRVLNLRLDGAQPRPGGNKLSSAASLFRTGSSGKTVTTGVKGMNEADIRNAVPDEAQLAALDAMTVSPGEARANAAQSHLVENTAPYLGKDDGK